MEIIRVIPGVLDKTEEDLRRDLQRLALHVENSPLAVMEWDRSFRLVRWSRRAEELLGWSPAEVLGNHPEEWKFLVEEDRAKFLASIQILIDGIEPGNVCDTRVYTKSGEVLNCEWYNSTLVNETGELVSILTLVQDVSEQKKAHDALLRYNEELEQRVQERTAALAAGNEKLHAEILERRRTEEALRVSEERFRKSFDYAPIGIALVSTYGRWLQVNPTLCEIVGYTQEELLDLNFHNLLHPADADNDRELVRQLVAGDLRSYHIEQRYFHKQGHVVWTEISVSVVRNDEGAPLYFIAQVQDISERKASEQILKEAKEAAELGNRAKSEFLAVVSHEIRTPMNAIIGMTNLLLETEITPYQRELVTPVLNSSEALLDIINSILDFSKIESGKMELERESFDLHHCIEDAFDLVSKRAGDKGIELAWNLEAGTPRYVVGDSTRLRQILVNLLANAVTFTEKGEVTVGARAREKDARTLELEFSVCDTGVGIPTEKLGDLFKPFTQVDSSRARRHEGTGLGLAICRNLTEIMGGVIWVESTLGTGTTFTFTILAEVAEEASYPEFSLTGKRIAVCATHAGTRSMLAEICRGWGMLAEELTVARLGERKASITNAFDAVLADASFLSSATSQALFPSDTAAVPLLSLVAAHDGLASPPQGERNIWWLRKPVKESHLLDALMSALCADVERYGDYLEPQKKAARASTMRVLLVEDNATNQKVAQLMLEGLGYRADVAANGFEALDALRRQRYDIVLMDVLMPEMDGLEATQRIRSDFPAPRQPWIIAMTASATQQNREQCLQAGMDDYITKPVRKEKLRDSLQRVAGKKRINHDNTAAQQPPARGIDPTAFSQLIADLSANAPDAIGELAEQYIATCTEALTTMRVAAADSDWKEVRRLSHSMKSSSAWIGALELAARCKALEDEAAAGTVVRCTDKLAGIEEEFTVVSEALEKELAS